MFLISILSFYYCNTITVLIRAPWWVLRYIKQIIIIIIIIIAMLFYLKCQPGIM